MSGFRTSSLLLDEEFWPPPEALVIPHRQQQLSDGRARCTAMSHLYVAVGRTVAVVITVLLALPLLALALNASPSLPLAPPLKRPLLAVGADFYLNLGALEVAKLTLDQALPRSELEWRLARARRFLFVALELDPANPGTYLNLAAAALAESKRSLARGLLEEAERRVAPDDGRSFFQIGRLYREAGDVDHAIAAWSRVDCPIGAWSGSGPDTHLALWGKELVRRGRWQAAVEVNRAAVRAAPARPGPYRDLATALSESEGVAAALTAMRQLVEAYPEAPWAYEEAAKLYARAGAVQEAAVWSRQAAIVRGSGEWMLLPEPARLAPGCRH